jgi:hypothetical protein
MYTATFGLSFLFGVVRIMVVMAGKRRRKEGRGKMIYFILFRHPAFVYSLFFLASARAARKILFHFFPKFIFSATRAVDCKKNFLLCTKVTGNSSFKLILLFSSSIEGS